MKLLYITAFIFAALFSGLQAQVKGTSAPMRIILKNAPSAGPRLTLIQPLLAGDQMVTVREALQRIVVEAADDNGISEVLINNKKSDSNDGKIFFSNIDLKAGENVVSISARDAKGNTTVKTFNITWLSVLAPPVISISTPQPGKGTKVMSSRNVISVKGTALSLNGIRLVTINSQRAQLMEDGSFSAEVALATGDNALVISATDSRGNTATDTFFVTRK
ncbi:MAG: cadherin-like beta sandwich domain-containing protein [Ignavibacteria bacterium]|jgi:hypothetical protein|nr:cadherin-like beta sandwich domain-containing protein [Ignavibacteria bacterium]MCU7504639.1 cadherin-like beta sandwich domain-containing protein [Ignavibacteria bacterium]MCU7517553.1 cadherin-like beta sandwich domain-containing protein [Ignavibacteria bacterium]